MNKKIGLLIVLSIMLIGIKVEAASYSMTLNTVNTEVAKDSVVDIYVNLNNISGINDGLNVCEFNLDYDSNKITINSIIGENNWNITQGEKIIADTSISVTANSNIVKINAKVSESNIITLKNINCSDGTNEYSASSNTLSFSLKQEQVNNNIINNQNNNSNTGTNNGYNSSGTVESPQTGVKELIFTFLLIAILSFIIKKIVSKKDLFKKI